MIIEKLETYIDINIQKQLKYEMFTEIIFRL